MPSKPALLSAIESFDPESKHLNAIIETPQGSRTKLDYDPHYGTFKFGKVMPKGFVFPYDFGFIPSTLAPDGDPLDVLVMMDESTAVGCLVRIRLLGVIEAIQKEKDKKQMRNDRLIAVPAESIDFHHLRTIEDLRDHKVQQNEEFFVAYNHLSGEKFTATGRFGPSRALKLVKQAAAAYRAKERET